MSKVNSIDDIGELIVHWSESGYINDVLTCDDNCDIEKKVDAYVFDSIIKAASGKVEGGYDKTSLSVKLKDGSRWCFECKFYLTRGCEGLLALLNEG